MKKSKFEEPKMKKTLEHIGDFEHKGHMLNIRTAKFLFKNQLVLIGGEINTSLTNETKVLVLDIISNEVLSKKKT